MNEQAPSGAPVPVRYTFRKAERLCARRLIDPLFQAGKSFNVYPLRFVYGHPAAGTHVSTPPTEPMQVLLSVSKRHFKRAHDRNRIKRQLREAWRHQKHRLVQPLLADRPLLVALLYIGREKPESVDFLSRRLRKGIERLLGELPANASPSAP